METEPGDYFPYGIPTTTEESGLTSREIERITQWLERAYQKGQIPLAEIWRLRERRNRSIEVRVGLANGYPSNLELNVRSEAKPQ